MLLNQLLKKFTLRTWFIFFLKDFSPYHNSFIPLQIKKKGKAINVKLPLTSSGPAGYGRAETEAYFDEFFLNSVFLPVYHVISLLDCIVNELFVLNHCSCLQNSARDSGLGIHDK